jgi:hypothetical protein
LARKEIRNRQPGLTERQQADSDIRYIHNQVSSSPSRTRLAASSRRLRMRAALGSSLAFASGDVVIACSSMQTMPRLRKSCSNKYVSSSFRPDDSGVAELRSRFDDAAAAAAETDDTRDETNADVGVTEPAMSRPEDPNI